MTPRSTVVRIGLCLIVIGGFFSAIAYPSWSSLNAALARDCWGAVEASSCPSTALSAGFWLPLAVESLGVLAAGIVVAIVGLAMGTRAPRPIRS